MRKHFSADHIDYRQATAVAEQVLKRHKDEIFVTRAPVSVYVPSADGLGTDQVMINGLVKIGPPMNAGNNLRVRVTALSGQSGLAFLYEAADQIVQQGQAEQSLGDLIDQQFELTYGRKPGRKTEWPFSLGVPRPMATKAAPVKTSSLEDALAWAEDQAAKPADYGIF